MQLLIVCYDPCIDVMCRASEAVTIIVQQSFGVVGEGLRTEGQVRPTGRVKRIVDSTVDDSGGTAATDVTTISSSIAPLCLILPQQHINSSLAENIRDGTIRLVRDAERTGIVLQPGQHGGQAAPVQVIRFFEL